MTVGALVKVQEGAEPRRQLAMLRPVANPAEIIDVQNETREFVHKALKEGRDFGKVPGVDRKTLLKPGAERVALGFGCHYGEPEIIEREIDHDRRVEWRKVKAIWKGPKGNRYRSGEEVTEGVSFGLYRYVVKVPLIHTETGRVIAVGIASCSTMESKYIDRPRDSENTALKMSHKRALVAACLLGFGLSDEFTQDMEDTAPIQEEAGQSQSDSAAEAAFPFGPQKGMAIADDAIGLELLVAGLDWCLGDDEKSARFEAFIGAAWKAIPEKIAKCPDDELKKVAKWAARAKHNGKFDAIAKECADAIHARGLDHEPKPKDATTGTALEGQKQEEAEQLAAKLTPKQGAPEGNAPAPGASTPSGASSTDSSSATQTPSGSTTQKTTPSASGTSTATSSASVVRRPGEDAPIEAWRAYARALLADPSVAQFAGMDVERLDMKKLKGEISVLEAVLGGKSTEARRSEQGRKGQAAMQANKAKRAAAEQASLTDDDEDPLGGDDSDDELDAIGRT